jgi:hypothetical protein
MLLLAVFALPALGAPTCQDKRGITTRCGTPGAMPVGWEPSPEQLRERELSRPPGPDRGQLLIAVSIIALLFSLIALMPKFDGSQGADWESQDKNDGA